MRTFVWLIGLALVGGLLVPASSLADCYDYADYTHIVGSLNLQEATRIAVSGDFAYVAGAGLGLHVIDISDPENPRQVALLDTPGFTYDVTVSDAYAYVADWASGLQVVDISDPRRPRIVGHAATMRSAARVAVSGDRAYVGEYSYPEYIGALEVIDIADPLSPRPLGSVNVPHALSEISGVAVMGSYAYVAANTAGLQVIDVSTPEDPSIAGSIIWSSSYAKDVAVNEHYAFVATGSGLKVVDVADPHNPALVAELHEGYAYGISIAGTQAYVAGGGGEWPPYGYFHAIDITDPESPAIIGAVAVPDVASSAVLLGKHVYVTDQGMLQVIAVAQLVDPPMTYSVDTPGYAEDFVLAGDYAYLSDNGALRVIDVSDPTNGRIVGSVDLPYSAGFACPLAVAGGYAYVAGSLYGYPYSTYYLRVIDISDPQNPRLVGAVQTAGAYKVAASGTYAYIAGAIGGDLYPGALQVVNVADPENPVVVAAIVLGSDRAYDIAISGLHAYVTAGMSFHVVDIADPLNPRLVTTLELPQYVEKGLALSGTLAYVAYDGAGLCVIDIADPEAPRIIGSLDMEWRTRGAVCVSENTVYVVGEKLQVVSVTDPQTPKYIGRLDDTPGLPTAVAVRDPYVFFTRYDYYGVSGLTIVPVQCLQSSSAPSGPDASLGPLRCVPNPSSGRAMIHLSATNAGDAEASIYDASGRLVRRLARRVLSAGDRDLSWDGRDQGGRDVAPGVYLVRVSTGRRTETTRVVILR